MLIDTEIEAKQERLRAQLAELPSLIVALSGGTDSAYLAWLAHTVLATGGPSTPLGASQRPVARKAPDTGHRAPGTGHPRVLAVTAVSASLPESERAAVADFVRAYAIPHEFIQTDELANPLYVANNPDRCYYCKDELFSKLDALARARGFAAVAYGVNVDDLGDFRPGQRAAAEHRVLTPLLDAGLTKAEIRELSRRAGLPTWSKPAAACLASRIAHGVAVTEDVLKRIERGEAALRALGFRQLRVRYHESQLGSGALHPPSGIVRIEIAPDELTRALTPEMAAKFAEIFKALGFKFVTLDLEGYRQGSLNPK